MGRYFCEHLQIQAFAQQTGYVIYATAIKIQKALKIIQIKPTFNSTVWNGIVSPSETLQHS